MLFTFQDSRLTEVSGIAASSMNDGVVWVHNDSGDEPVLYGVGSNGKTTMTLRLSGARAVDWEDMAVGGRHLFAGDIGDNRERRTDIQIYRVAEPSVFDGERTIDAERMDLRYPDGAQDAEALLVHPKTGEIGIVTKVDDGPARLYVAPGFSTGRFTLRNAASVPVESATGAAVSPDGRAIVVRDYVQAFLFDLDGDDLASAFDAPGKRIDMPFAIQAEAITFSADGRSLLTTNEGSGATVHEVELPGEDEAGTATTAELPKAERISAEPTLAGILAALAAATLLVWVVTASSRRRRASDQTGVSRPGGRFSPPR